jgi:hypothetical protein
MPASRLTKIIIWTIVGAFAVGIAWFAHGFYRAWHKFASEERICGAFHPVMGAIDRFYERTGTLPTNLTQLVPTYVAQIPTTPVADSIDYRIMPDGTNWQLTVHSRITGAPRVFVQRSSRQFTKEERRQSVTGFHGWVVFRESP